MILKEQTEKLKQDVLTRMPQSIVQNFKNDINQLKVDKIKEKALQVGDKIPNPLFKNIEGNDIELNSIHTSDFLIFNFYRGGWCPYCNMEIREYERLKNEFKTLGASIVAVSTELPELANQTNLKNQISYPIVTDIDAKFMKALGIVFQLSEEAKKDFVGFGMDFQKIHGNDNFELPVPAIYIIDKNLKIVFVHFEEDYMTRLEPTELLQTLKNEII